MPGMSVRGPRWLLAILVALHIGVIIASNYLVQIPVTLLGLHSTWGAFSFPVIFLVTDLTVRLLGAPAARQVVARVMLPALVASYVVSVLFQDGAFAGFGALGEFNTFVFRIAVASFAAYALGQLMDIRVFDRIRAGGHPWWVAPAASGVAGQAVDTAVFFWVAFWRSSDPFMAENWIEIAFVDYGVKLAVSLLMFVPLYGIVLNMVVQALLRRSH